MKFIKFAFVPALVLATLSVVSCSSTQKTSSSQRDDQSAAAQEVKTQTPKPAVADELSAYKTIYFDFNKYVIRPDQVAAARGMASDLKMHPERNIVIQGNTDDRGSAEYNIALGTKRANSLKKFLVTQGVSAMNISTVSFGKEHPAVAGNNEEAWSQNRRDDVIIKK